MEKRFKNSRARLDRAYLHFEAIQSEWNSILGNESAGPAIRQDKNSGWHILSANLTPDSIGKIASNQLSLEVGEMVYQLRAALDGLIWDVVTYMQGTEPPSDANRLEFPIRPIGEFKKCAFHKFPFPQKLIEWMETIQLGAAIKSADDPDYGLQATLEDIHDLARFDRHRRLRIVAVVPSTSSVEVETTPSGGSIVAHEWLDCDLFNGKYDFVRLKVLCPGGLIPYHLRIKTSLKFEVSVEDIQFYDGDDLGVQLGRFIKAVEHVIDRFDAEFA